MRFFNVISNGQSDLSHKICLILCPWKACLIKIHLMYHRARSVRSMPEIPGIIYYFFSENADNNLRLWFQFTGFVYELKFPKR